MTQHRVTYRLHLDTPAIEPGGGPTLWELWGPYYVTAPTAQDAADIVLADAIAGHPGRTIVAEAWADADPNTLAVDDQPTATAEHHA